MQSVEDYGPIIFVVFIILFFIALDYILYKEIKKYINKAYKKSLDVINIFNLSKEEIQMKDEQNIILRMLFLSLFWLIIYLFSLTKVDLIRILEDTSANSAIRFIIKYEYSTFIIIGYFLYFILHIISKTNAYLRAIDIIISTVFTAAIIFIM